MRRIRRVADGAVDKDTGRAADTTTGRAADTTTGRAADTTTGRSPRNTADTPGQVPTETVAPAGRRTALAAALTGSGRDKGVAALEFAGFLPILLLVAMAAIQLGIVGYAALQAGSGARAGARIGSQEAYRGQCTAAGNAAMSDWIVANGGNVACVDGDVVTATATVPVPALIPVFDVGTIVREVSMPSDSTR